jgi:hypothetical protein
MFMDQQAQGSRPGSRFPKLVDHPERLKKCLLGDVLRQIEIPDQRIRISERHILKRPDQRVESTHVTGLCSNHKRLKIHERVSSPSTVRDPVKREVG